MQCVQKRIFALLLLSVFIFSAIAAPLTENRLKDETETDLDKVVTSLTSQGAGIKDTQEKQVQDTEDAPADDTEEDEDAMEDNDDDRGQEVINYQDIQVDHNSKVTSENEGKKPETEDNDDEDEEEFDEIVEDEDDEDEVDDDDEEEEAGYMLTPTAARELMLELRDPVEVAKFVVETDDAAGFLRALRLLLHDGYITEEEAYGLKDEVAVQLRNLLMLQQVELSRALYETYQPQVEEDPNADLEGLLLNQPQKPAEYYDYANMINQDEMPYGSSQGNIYDAYQEAIEEESSEALAEIAEILAQRIARGEITPEEGAQIMRKVIQLLPETYWGQSDEGMSSESMTSEYRTDDFNLLSQAGEFIGEDDDEEDDEEGMKMEPDVENFEEELLEAGPDGLVKEIEEEDENGDDDAAELEEEAENIADELVDELKGGMPSKVETVKFQRPGAKSVVKVGPSNDVMDQDVEQDWKDMSLLLDGNIPESVLRSLGISITKPGKEEVAEPEKAVSSEERGD